MVNNGGGAFAIEPGRASDQVLRNSPADYRRHVGNALLDMDNDGDGDLALGQLRHFDPLQVNARPSRR